RTAPVRSSFVALLASGMLLGYVGACLRLVGTSHFADQYVAASAAQRAGIVQAYDSLPLIINTLFSAGDLLAGVALVLVASATARLPELARWSTMLLGLVGLLDVAKAAGELATGADLRVLALPLNVLLIVSLVAIAARFAARVRATTQSTQSTPAKGSFTG